MKQPTLATSVVSGVSDEVVDVVADEDVDTDMDEGMSMMNMVKVVEGLGVAVGAKGLEDVAFTVESKVTLSGLHPNAEDKSDDPASAVRTYARHLDMQLPLIVEAQW
ncbi:hypothetical protein PF004_g1251 [Phytophthora fragariae]|uniref:Uncharacterized protein n=1 Tax=Phytophthora fragariae TaxID=53985 RepID=A0A6G0PSX0_9STRA|nr:hypothetical protein PF004_g1251 [Phytophthora fragariae]